MSVLKKKTKTKTLNTCKYHKMCQKFFFTARFISQILMSSDRIYHAWYISIINLSGLFPVQ